MAKTDFRRLALLVIIFLLSVSLAAAVTVNVDQSPPDYDRNANKVVTATANCANQKSTIEIINSERNLIYIKGGENQWSLTYNTKSDPADGKYLATARCEDGTTADKEFCVNQNGCTSTTSTQQQSSGGGRSCTSDYQCQPWSTCTVQGQQTRQCLDQRCNRPPQTETQPCQCQESWVCRDWSACQSGQQTRTCGDEHACGTSLLRPATQQSCSTGFISKIKEVILPSQPKPATTSEENKFQKWWDDYGVIFLAALAAILLVILIGWLVHKRRAKKKTYNFDELKEWIAAEQRMDTSNEDIKQILMDKTGWTTAEIQQAFASLRNNESSDSTTGMENENN